MENKTFFRNEQKSMNLVLYDYFGSYVESIGFSGFETCRKIHKMHFTL